MSDLIRKSDLLELLVQDENLYLPTIYILRILSSVPEVDAVEVVRCKDCKHWYPRTEKNYYDGKYYCSLDGYFIDENGYCVYGERPKRRHEE